MTSRLPRSRRTPTIRSTTDIWLDNPPPSSFVAPTSSAPHLAQSPVVSFPQISSLGPHFATPPPSYGFPAKFLPPKSVTPSANEAPLSWRDLNGKPDLRKSPSKRRKAAEQEVLIRQAAWGIFILVAFIFVAIVVLSKTFTPEPVRPAPQQPRATASREPTSLHKAIARKAAPSFRDSLSLDGRYLTSAQHGGFAHQVMSLYHLTYLSTILSRTPLVSPFTFGSHHASSHKALAVSTVFDMDRFRSAVNVTTIDWRDVRPPLVTGAKNEQLGCWTAAQMSDHELQERTKLMGELGLDPSFYPLRITAPPLVDGQLKLNDLQVAYSFLSGFDADPSAQVGLIDQALHTTSVVTLSQKSHRDPERHVFCVDHSLFHTVSTGAAQTTAHLDQYEHTAFRAHGVALRFVSELEEVGADIVSFVLGHRGPFVGVHISARADCFGNQRESSECVHWLPRYVDAVERIRILAAQVLGSATGRKTREQRHHVRALNVLVTTDVTDIGFLGEIVNMGWTLLDHNDLELRQRYGPWDPAVIESVVSSRAVGFVGTKACSESTLTALRVRAWRAGPVELI